MTASLFLYNDKLSIANCERTPYQINREGGKSGRVSVLRDIDIHKTHAGHIRILLDLNVSDKKIQSFKELYAHWQSVFSVSVLNKKFYSEIFNWYQWAIRSVDFLNVPEKKKDAVVYHSQAVIRLLTRLIFCWFIKEKHLISESLFDVDFLKKVLVRFDPTSEKSSTYYKAILQNLFFATLNTEMNPNERKFLPKPSGSGYNENYMDHLSYRYEELFVDSKKALDLFSEIPFLNGGLFECLDRRVEQTSCAKELRYDGFSSKEKKNPKVPNSLFFGSK